MPEPGTIQVRAAGGVVTRTGANGTEVLVVHRPAYDDWSLPKGKLEPGEGDEAAARREVLEETGVDAVITAPLGSVTYTDRRGRPKRVEYFAMTPRTVAPRAADEEVDVVAWWSLDRARVDLTYPHDRELVTQVGAGVSSEFACYIVRHADAGKRGAIADDRRPLVRRGRAQAEAIAATLADAGITRLVASPYTRCIETLEPLATRIGVAIEARDDLAEGSHGISALALVERADAPLALCSHGDVIGELMDTLHRRGVPLDDDRVAKGSTWTLTVRDGGVVAAHYVPAPRSEDT